MLEQKPVGRRTPAIQVSGEEEQKKQQAQKTEYRNVHGNRKEANVAGAESAGRKWKEMRSGK